MRGRTIDPVENAPEPERSRKDLAIRSPLSHVANRDDGELDLTTRPQHRDRVSSALTEQRLSNGRVDADETPPGVDLIGADELVRHLMAILILQRDSGAEVDPRDVCLLGGR